MDETSQAFAETLKGDEAASALETKRLRQGSSDDSLPGEESSRLRVHLLDGSCLTRDLSASESMFSVFAWLSSVVGERDDWSLVAPRAQMEGCLYASEETLHELGLFPQADLVMQTYS